MYVTHGTSEDVQSRNGSEKLEKKLDSLPMSGPLNQANLVRGISCRPVCEHDFFSPARQPDTLEGNVFGLSSLDDILQHFSWFLP